LFLQEPQPELKAVDYPVLVARPADNTAIDRISKNVVKPLLVVDQAMVDFRPVAVFRIMAVLTVAAVFSDKDCQDFAVFHYTPSAS
jgi:hypothetical protein